MLEHNGLHEIFNPSVSWIMKSGVHLEYTPEDTLKSAIFVSEEDASVTLKEPIVTEVCSSNDDLKIITSKFNSVTADEINCANAGDSLQKPYTPHNNLEECSKEATNESNDLQPGSENCCHDIESDSGGLDKVHATDGDGGSLSVGVKRPTKRSVIPKKPAPYLKRRQGVSAWCSKIRKQGLPVKEPAVAVIKQQQCMNSPQTPVVQESVQSEQSKAQSSKTNLPRRVKSSVKNQSANKNINVSCRGYKQSDYINNCESSDSKNDTVGDEEEEVKNKDDKENRVNNHTDDDNNNKGDTNNTNDYSQYTTTHLLARPMMINSRDLEKSINHLSVELMHTNLFNESHKEARDLEEFELLEEFVETSSFPNLTTSFISKLNKSKSGLHRNQKQTVEVLKGDQSAFKDDSAVSLNDKQLSTFAQHHSEHLHHLTSVYNQPVNNLNITTTQFTSAFSSSSSTNDNLHNVDNILANTTAPINKECKVTPHFHIIKAPCEEIQSSSSTTVVNRKQTEKCNDNDDANNNEMISTFQQINTLPASSNPLPQCDHYDFDDAHSWSFSASDLNDIKLSSGLDFSETSLTSCCGDLGNQPNESLTRTTAMKTTRPILISESNKPTSCIPNHQEVGKVKRITFSDTVYNNTCTSISQNKQNKKSIQSHNENDVIISTNNSNELLKGELNSSDQGNVTCGDEQSVVKQWINRLEEEVKRFKVENANLNKMKTELQDKSRQLETEKARFEENKMKEKKEFEEYKEGEMKKLKKEKRVLEEYQRALKTMPNKKDREEIERLKQELDESRVDMGKREIRWHAALSRLRTRNEELEGERDELKSRISRLEEERISLQAQLTKLKVSTANESSGNKHRLSSSLSLRQTVNSISQSISFTPHNGNNTSKALDDGNISHRQHSRQPSVTRSLSSSSRPVSRLNHPDRFSTMTSSNNQTTTSSNHHHHQKSNNTTSNKTSNTIQSTQKLCQQESTSSVTGTRESIASGGGYFTGDDDCGSIGGSSGRVVKFSTRSTDPECDNDVDDIHGGNLLCNGDHSKQKSTHLHRNKEINCDKNNVIQPSLDAPISQRKENVNRLGNNCQERLPIPGTAASGTIVRSVKHTDGSIEQTYSNGAVIVSYANGSVKEIFPDTITTVVSLFNGDIKRTLPDGRVIYHYAADGTVQTTYPDGTEEIKYPDGHQETIHSHTLQQINPPTAAVDPLKSLPNEQICRRLSNGDKEILLPNGQREIHSNCGIKCRIYPDGTTKTVFPDGRHETRYSSGRLRVKDANGTLLLDTRLPVGSTCHPAMNNNNNLDNVVSRIPNDSSSGDSLKISLPNARISHY